MHATELIIVAVGLFVIGAVIGLVAVASIGIRREERRFRECRRSLQEQGKWLGPDGPDRFVPEEAPDAWSQGARVLTGLWVRRDQGAEPEELPWYERRTY
jgi:hypothetical protein